MNRGAAFGARLLDPFPVGRAHAARMLELTAGGDDVRARREDGAHLVKVTFGGHVEHAVRAEREDLADVAGGGHPGRRQAAQFAGVPAGLGR